MGRALGCFGIACHHHIPSTLPASVLHLQFPLSAAYALGRITNALEQKWGIV